VSENFNEIETKSQQLTNRKRINCHLPVAWIESANINIIYIFGQGCSELVVLAGLQQCPSVESILEYYTILGSLTAWQLEFPAMFALNLCVPADCRQSSSEIKSWMRKQGKQWVSVTIASANATQNKTLRFFNRFRLYIR